jgi:asparagine synthase (glutamine-hydrolysing)
MFAGAIRLDGGSAPTSFRAAVRGAPYCREQPLNWVTTDGLLAVVGPAHGACPPAIVRSGPVTVVGVARIDNRADMLAWLGDVDRSIGDLALAGQVALRRGVSGVAKLLGDFAFVVWEADTRTLIAARDTFGVKKLYYAMPSPGIVTFSSRAELIADGDDYNLEYLAARLASCPPDPAGTAFHRVYAVPAATVVRFDRWAPRVTGYWDAFEVQANGDQLGSERDQCDAVRELLIEGTQSRLSADPTTWSHLSGGLDSSSVVSVAQWLERAGTIPHGLAGTVSFIDSIGTAADEREYSDAVVAHYGVPNERIAHQLDRRDILVDPPRFDQPTSCSYGVASRELQVANTVERSGGSAILTGIGGDNLFLGTMFFFADWVAHRQLSRAIREMAHRAAVGHVSFWELAIKNAILPLLPSQVRRVLTRRQEGSVPRWLNGEMARRYDLQSRTGHELIYGGVRGSQYEYGQAAAVAAIPSILSDGVVGETLDIRHPYLHRPLVELALHLSPEMCVRPHARKWILREAMRGILPDYVRTRVGKGNGAGQTAWALDREQPLVDALFHDSMLAQLGVIDISQLRAAFAMAHTGTAGGRSINQKVAAIIDVELWLRVRSGRWGQESRSYVETSYKHETRCRSTNA